MFRNTVLLCACALLLGIYSVTAGSAQNKQPPAASVTSHQQNKVNVQLKAKLPNYKGPSRFLGRHALISFSPDGQLVAMSGTNRTITIWDLKTGALKATLKAANGGISGFSFSPDGHVAATRDYLDKSVRLWDVSAWELKAMFPGRKHNLETKLKAGLTFEEEFGPVSFSPDGRTVLSEREDDLVAVSNVPAGTEQLQLNHDTNDHGFAKETLKALFLPGSTRHFLALQSGFSNDGRFVFTINGDKFAKIWEADTGKLKTSISNNERLYRASFTPDGTRLLTVEQQGGMKLWDVETGQLVNEIARKGFLEDLMKSYELSPDGKLIATFHLGDTRLWDAKTGALKSKLEGSETTDATFSADGRWLATASRDKKTAAKIWDVTTGEVKTTIPLIADRSLFVKFSPDGSMLVTTNDQGVALWDAASGELLANLSEARYPVAFSSDGRTLVSGGRNNTAFLWEIPPRP